MNRRTMRHRRDEDERGATLVEYTLMVALIALACFGAMRFLGSKANDGISTSNSSMFETP
jgi:Flp pilus assembly pilin Flp